MTIPETINKAIEGGFRRNNKITVHSFIYFLSPDFWKCLGKAIGWGIHVDKEKYYIAKEDVDWANIEAGDIIPSTQCDIIPSTQCKESWLYQWHRFIDHLAEGGTAEEFFKELK